MALRKPVPRASLEQGEYPLPPMDSGISEEDLKSMGIGVPSEQQPVPVPQEIVDSAEGDQSTLVPPDIAEYRPVKRAEVSTKPTGAYMDVSFIQRLNDAPDDQFNKMYDSLDPVLKHVYDRSYGMNISPKWAAEQAQQFYKEQDSARAAQNDPVVKAQLSRLNAVEAQREQKKVSALDGISSMRNTVQEILNHPGMTGSVGAKNWSYLFGLKGDPISGTPEADFKSLLDQVKGGAFLQAFDSIRGGGSITETEGEKATQAIIRIQQSQSEEGFKKSMNDFLGILDKAESRINSSSPKASTSAAPPTNVPSFTPGQRVTDRFGNVAIYKGTDASGKPILEPAR